MGGFTRIATVAISALLTFSISANAAVGNRLRQRVVRQPAAAPLAPAVGYSAFFPSFENPDKKQKLMDAGYVNQSLENSQPPVEVYATKPKLGMVETVKVKRDVVSGEVAQIVQSLEYESTGIVITNMIDYNEKSSSRCSNMNPQTGKPGVAINCSTINLNLCNRFNNAIARKEIMPVHHRAMSAQLGGIRRVRLGVRNPENVLVNSERERCNTLASNLTENRPIMVTIDPPPPSAQATAEVPANAPAANLWSTKISK
jgi:hypothetical protein